MTDPASSSMPSSDSSALAALLAPMGAVLLSRETVDSAVGLITSLAAETIPGTTGAGVTLAGDRGKRSVAPSNTFVERADLLQYGLDEGPCLTAWRDRVTVRIDDVTREERWPEWTSGAASIGVRAMLSVPLVAGGVSIGALEVYSTEPAAFDVRAEHLLELFARQAAILLDNVQTLSDAREMNVQITEALQNRDVVGRAKGILLEGGAVDDSAAFSGLVATSQGADATLHLVANYLIASVTSRNLNRQASAPALTEETATDARYQLFEAARRSADWTIEQLWLAYLALGGTLVVLDLEAYLAGLAPLPPNQQDVLACALNERLTELSQELRVPYLTRPH